MAIIDKIQLSGTVYTIGNETTTAVTSASTDNEIPTAKAVYDAIPKGSGGSGKAIEAGRGISITTGETADTVSFNLPISAGTGTNALIYNSTINFASGNYSHAEGEYTTASGKYSHTEGYIANAKGYASHAEGESTKSKGYSSHAEGTETEANGDYSHAEGHYTRTTNESEHSSGGYNNSVSASTTFGDSGNTLFSVGNGKSNSARHNAFEIRQNGDIYISDTNDTSTTNYYQKPMIKLQDALGGGGSSYTAGDGIDITNDVISVTGKVDTSTYDTYTAATDTALASKQTTLTAGTGISIVDNVISATGGGGGSITIDPSLDSGSTNPVANSAITKTIYNQTARFNGYASDGYLVNMSSRDDGNAISIDAMKIKTVENSIQQTASGIWLYTSTINGKKAVSSSSSNTKDFSLVETSAITTSISSSSTDAQVPSAKAVYDQFGGLKLVKLTQSEYDALSPNYDVNTLYVIN